MMILVLALVAFGAAGFNQYLELETKRVELLDLRVTLSEAKANLQNNQSRLETTRRKVTTLRAKLERYTTLTSELKSLKSEIGRMETARQDVIKRFTDEVEMVRAASAGMRWQDITLASGQVLQGVSIQRITDTDLTLHHSQGIAKIMVKDLPLDLKLRLRHGMAPYVMPERQTLPIVPQKSPIAPVAGSAVPAFVNGKDGAQGLVLVKGTNGAGSAFLARARGGLFLFTAVHVLLGIEKPTFTLTDGTALPITDSTVVEVSDEEGLEDVARIPLQMDFKTGLEIAEEMSLGAAITALGNSSGEGVITNVAGNIAGVGPKEVEVTALVVPGNSGGPVILSGTNKVVGIITRASTATGDVWTSGTPFGGVRRFAARPTKVLKWSGVQLASLQAQMARLERIRMDTRSVAVVMLFDYYRNGITAHDGNQGEYSIKEVLKNGTATSVGRAISNAVATANTSLGRGTATLISGPVVRQTYTEFFAKVRAASGEDVAFTDPAEYARFLRPRFRLEADLRKRVATELNTFAQSILTAEIVR